MESTFRYLHGIVVRRLEKHNIGNDTESEADTSSSETAVMGEKEISRKRKRGDSETLHSVSLTPYSVIDTLFKAVCGVLHRIMLLIKRHPTRNEDYAIKHMRHALKTPPETLAKILGDAIFISNNFLQTPRRRLHRKTRSTFELCNHLEDRAYVFCLSPLVDLWEVNLSAHLSHRAYLSSCTIPSLQLLDTCQKWQSSDAENDCVLTRLERLLMTHVILPFRASILIGTGFTDLGDEILYQALSESLIPALEAHPLAPKASEARRDRKTQQYMKMSLLSQFFGLALKARPLHSQKLRQAEQPWLEKLFREIDKCATALLPPERPRKAQKEHKRLLVGLLQKCFDAHIILSVNLMKDLMEKGSGLWEQAHDVGIEWRLVSLCLLIDADLVVMPAPNAEAKLKDAYRQPNECLDTVLTALTDCQPCNDEEQQYLLDDILVPMVKSFAAARDLPRFIEYWKKHLHVIQQRRESANKEDKISGPHSSIWEDDTLLNEVALSIKLLTAHQIHDIVAAASSDLNVPIPRSLSDTSISLRSLVVLDCVFRGLEGEDTIDRLAEDAQSIFVLLENLVIKSTEISNHRWRLWNTMTSIAQRWPPGPEHLPIKNSTHAAICFAFDLITKLPDWQPSESKVDYTEVYHAFRFTLSNAWLGDHVWQREMFSSRQKAFECILKIFDIMKPFCERIEHDILGNFKRAENITETSMSGAQMTYLHGIYIRCIHDVLSSAKILR